MRTIEESVILSSKRLIEISESDELGRFNLKFIICDFGANANGVCLNRDTIDDWKDTLMLMPLVGKISTNKDGNDDFTTHQAKKVYEMKNNKLTQKLKFGTDAFGTFFDVSIEEIDGVECITATAKVWERFEKACEIIKERFENNEPLGTSWEVGIIDSEMITIDGKQVKQINQGSFLAHAMLGKYITPAYQISKMLEVAEEEQIDEIEDAIMQDLISINEEISQQSDENSVGNKLEESEGGNRMGKENEVVVSALTSGDIRSLVNKSIYALEGNGRYFWGVTIYPYDYVAYAKLETYGSDGKVTLEDDYVKFTYVVNSDETISITGEEAVKMVFVPIADQTALEGEIAELKTEVSTKVEEIIKLGETIQANQTVISEKDVLIAELEPFRVQAEELAETAKQAELSEKKEALTQMVISTKYFTSEEIETSEELKVAISELNESAVKVLIANKVMEVASKTVKEVEVSSVEDVVISSTDLNASQNYEYSQGKESLVDILRKNKKRR